VAVQAASRGRATAYVPEFGSSFPDQPTGGDVVAVALRRRAGRWRAAPRRLARGLGLQNPLGAAIGPDGDLYVTLWTRGRVVRFDLPRPRPAAAVARPEPAAAARPQRPAAASPAPPAPSRPPALFTRLDPWLPGAPSGAP
jgi:hypothetical protein